MAVSAGRAPGAEARTSMTLTPGSRGTLAVKAPPRTGARVPRTCTDAPGGRAAPRRSPLWGWAGRLRGGAPQLPPRGGDVALAGGLARRRGDGSAPGPLRGVAAAGGHAQPGEQEQQ